jgi:hypothetical protein
MKDGHLPDPGFFGDAASLPRGQVPFFLCDRFVFFQKGGFDE